LLSKKDYAATQEKLVRDLLRQMQPFSMDDEETR